MAGPQQSASARGAQAPLHIYASFDFQDFVSGSKTIGVIGGNYLINRVVIEVTQAFDAGAQLSVGTPSSHGLLMTTAENDLSLVAAVEKEPNYRNLSSQVFAVFLSGAPTQGQATVYLSYS
jgi:hypothetical protein